MPEQPLDWLILIEFLKSFEWCSSHLRGGECHNRGIFQLGEGGLKGVLIRHTIYIFKLFDKSTRDLVENQIAFEVLKNT